MGYYVSWATSDESDSRLPGHKSISSAEQNRSGVKRAKFAAAAQGILFLCVLVILFVIALVYAYQYLSSLEIDCVRQTNTTYNCQTRTLFLDWVQTSEKEFVSVVNIKINEDCDSDGCMYFTTFVAKNGDTIPLSFFPENDRGIANTQVSEIGPQLAQGVDSIKHKTKAFRGNPPPFCYVAVFIVLGVAVVVVRDWYLTYRRRHKTKYI